MNSSVDVQTPPVSLTLNHLPLPGEAGRFAPELQKAHDIKPCHGLLHILLVLFQLLDFGQRGLGLPHGKQRAAPNGDASLFPDEVIAHP